MIHGWPDNADVWEPQVQALKHMYRCARFTLPGFNLNDEKKGWTIPEITKLILNITEQISPDKPVILMMHDWGCAFGFQFYHQHPNKISKIISIDIGDWFTWKQSASKAVQKAAYLYQALLAFAWRIGGPIGNGISRVMARLMQSPTHSHQITYTMNYPYQMFWFGGDESYQNYAEPFNPTCPFLFVFGTKKPFCLLYTSPSPRDQRGSRMPSSA